MSAIHLFSAINSSLISSRLIESADSGYLRWRPGAYDLPWEYLNVEGLPPRCLPGYRQIFLYHIAIPRSDLC